MYDELIERLRETSIDFGESDHVSVMLIEAADAIDDLQGKAKVLEKLADHWCSKAPEWIPVTERLPDHRTTCLIADDWSVVVGWRNLVGEWYDVTGDRLKYVTHWMPLPQLPESVSE